MKTALLTSSVTLLVALIVAIDLAGRRRETFLLRVDLEVASQVGDLKTELARAFSRIEALENRPSSLAHSSQRVAAPRLKKESLPILVEGSYARENDAIIYASDAKLRVASDTLVSSPTGVMVSDEDQKMVVGDLRLENATSTMDAIGAVIEMEKQRVFATGISLTRKKMNDSSEQTDIFVAPPAVQGPRQP